MFNRSRLYEKIEDLKERVEDLERKLRNETTHFEKRVFKLESNLNDEIFFIDHNFNISSGIISWVDSKENDFSILVVDESKRWGLRRAGEHIEKSRIANTKEELEDMIKSKFCNKKVDK